MEGISKVEISKKATSKARWLEIQLRARANRAMLDPMKDVFAEIDIDRCEGCEDNPFYKDGFILFKGYYRLRESAQGRILTVQCPYGRYLHDSQVALFKAHNEDRVRFIETPTVRELNYFGGEVMERTRSPLEPLILFFGPYPRLDPMLDFCRDCQREPFHFLTTKNEHRTHIQVSESNGKRTKIWDCVICRKVATTIILSRETKESGAGPPPQKEMKALPMILPKIKEENKQ